MSETENYSDLIDRAELITGNAFPPMSNREASLVAKLADAVSSLVQERDLAWSELVEARSATQWWRHHSHDETEDFLSMRAERDAALAVIDKVRDWNRLMNGRPRYRELDEIVNPEEWADPDEPPKPSELFPGTFAGLDRLTIRKGENDD